MEDNKWVTWHLNLAKVLNQCERADSLNTLLYSLEELVDATSGLATKYVAGDKPEITHQRLLASESKHLQINHYADVAYLLDPFYRLIVDSQTTGVYALKSVAPAGFYESEYYRLFYSLINVRDEVCIIVRVDDGVFFSLSLVRSEGKNNFSQREISDLESVYPVIGALISNWYLANSERTKEPLGWQLDEALNLFGSSVLTPKECAVLRFTLQGYSVKFIAQKMDNAIETIKYHRKNMYRKLDINSQSELFNLFITALKALPKGARTDPLMHLNK
ncbi:helix-turn-helix transcriptional regulator [Pseudoalteromonas pernae]|uniref:helix-turn-helix transcriptional regulator n=1 Tax=Pseudoalteromonas pernae TaxID=3118054 RepID=UPI003242242F